MDASRAVRARACETTAAAIHSDAFSTHDPLHRKIRPHSCHDNCTKTRPTYIQPSLGQTMRPCDPPGGCSCAINRVQRNESAERWSVTRARRRTCRSPRLRARWTRGAPPEHRQRCTTHPQRAACARAHGEADGGGAAGAPQDQHGPEAPAAWHGTTAAGQ